MNSLTLYHNPGCSKSRAVLELLESRSLSPVIVEYLKTPLNLAELTQLRAHFELKDFVRHDEPLFKELKLTLDDEAGILKAMVTAPILMQRPIVSYKGHAIIGRPPEIVLSIL